MQVVKDFGLKLRSDRKTQVLSGLACLALMYLFLGESKVRGPRKPPPTPVQDVQNDPNERWTDLMERFGSEVRGLTQAANQNKQDILDLKKNMTEYEATTAEIFKKILERLQEVDTARINDSGRPGPTSLGGDDGTILAASAPSELVPLGPPDAVGDAPPPRPKQVKLAAIMPGDSVRVKLLSGVNAPTDGSPYPVVLKVISDVQGPDGNSLPIGEARVIAASQGSLTDSRVLLRLTRLSMRLPNGRRKEFAVDGWVVGEDGIRGMEGVLIDPIGQVIGAAAIAGGISGIGQGIAQGNTVNNGFNGGANQTSYVQNGQIPEFAAGVAASSAAQEYVNIVRQRAALLVPVVQALSGREATAIFSQSLAIPDLLDQLDDEDPSVVYTSLD
jgi:hypothetical protein